MPLSQKTFNIKGFEVLIHAFVTSCLDYCNSGAPLSHIHQLQIVQNYAARQLLTFYRKKDDITPIL